MSDLFASTPEPSDHPEGHPERHLEGLNDAQRDAVVHQGGRDGAPLIVLAGPGTGKTRVIISRIAHLIAAHDADPGSILALTFTNKAAGEMRDRLGQMLDPLTAERVHAHTFNGFGASLLRRFSDLAGLPREPALIDSAQRLRIMRTIVRDQGLFRDAVASGLDEAIRASQKRIGAMTAAGLTPRAARERVRAHNAVLDAQQTSGALDDAAGTAERALTARLSEVVDLWEAFDRECLSRGLIGFDHQIAWATRMLAGKPIARAFAQRDYRHVVVDEFQDVNDAQIELLAQIAPPGSSSDLCVVGDDDQAIYGFRGADDRAFQKFEARWPGARTVMLEENYRSATVVLDAAASVIGRAHERFRDDKIVRRAQNAGDEPHGASVEGVVLETHYQAGEVIATAVQNDLATRPDARLGDHAVIARNWIDLDRIRGALELEGIPCVVSKGPAPADDPGVEDVLAWVDLLLNPTHAWSARRLLLRPPFLTDVEWVRTIDADYHAMVSRIRKQNGSPATDADDDQPGTGQPRTAQPGTAQPGFMEWLRDRLARNAIASEDEGVPANAARFVRTWEALRESTATLPAHAALAEIAQRTDVVHAELLDGRGRSARVSAIVGLLRFARERAGRLEEPRDLRAFTAYLGDLDPDDRSFRTGRLTHEDDEDEADPADAVTLLTAHRSKGLEFDTVYLPRVESQHGYPARRRDEEEESIPDWLAEGEEAARAKDANAAHQDEERRLFYVACTRAERRLVILGALPKSTPRGMHFFWELRGERGLLVERDAAEVLSADARDGVDHEAAESTVPGWAARDARRRKIRSAGRLARLDCARALADAGNAGDDGDRFDEAVRRMRHAGARLAVVESAARGETVPSWIEDPDLLALHADLNATDEESEIVPAHAVIPKVKAPVHLNYTMLDQWRRCPRCFGTRFVLKLKEAETSETVVGKAVHEALETFYTQFRRAGEDEQVPEPALEDLLTMGDDAFENQWSSGEIIDPSKRDRVRALLTQGYEHLHDATLNPVAIEQTIKFAYQGEGKAAGTHWFTAKIDRIDESAGGYRVVDYKTGKAKKSQTEVDKKDWQLGIYAMAMRAFAAVGPPMAEEPVGVDAEVLEHRREIVFEKAIESMPVPAGAAEYWVLATGERGRVSFDELAEYEPKLRKAIDNAIAGMLEGEYPKGSGCQGFCKLLDPGELAGED